MKTKDVTTNDQNYVVRELLLGDVVDLLGRDGMNFSLELFKRAVIFNGEPIGDGALLLPLASFTELSRAVNELNVIDTQGKS